MNDMKCPFCNQPLHDDHDGYYSCYSDNCCVSGGTLDTWQELIRTRKSLEQSEICCTEWEKQALDYKAENIGLQSKLDICEGALEEYKDWFNNSQERLKIAVDALKYIIGGNLGLYPIVEDFAEKALEQITAEQKVGQ